MTNQTNFLSQLSAIAKSNTSKGHLKNTAGTITVDSSLLNTVTSAGDTIVDIFALYFSGLVWTSNSKIYTWGGNSTAGFNSQLGQNSTNAAEYMSEVQFPAYLKTAGYTISDVRVIGFSIYVLWSNGDLYAWGYNGYGQLGIGSTTNAIAPVLSTSGVASFVSRRYAKTTAEVSGGSSYITSGYCLILKSNGTYYGTGYNSYGQIGNGNTTQQTSWTAVVPPSGKTISTIYATMGYSGADTTFCKTTDNHIYMVGYNGTGCAGLGNTTSPSSWTLVPFFNSISVADIQSRGGDENAAGNTTSYFNYTVALDTAGNVYTCGYGANGCLGNGSTSQTTSFAQITLTKAVSSVVMGTYQCYVIFTDNTYARWGSNGNGQLGNGNTTQQNSPIYGSLTVSKIFHTECNGRNLGYSPIFILDTSGNLWACGYNANGSLGLGNTSIGAGVSTLTKVPFSNGSSILNVEFNGSNGGGSTYIALTNSKQIYGAGLNTSNFELNLPIAINRYGFVSLPTSI